MSTRERTAGSSPPTRVRALVGVALILVVAFLLALLMQGSGAEGSTLGRGAGGWLGVFAVLEQRGLGVERLDRRLQSLVGPSDAPQTERSTEYAPDKSTLVTVFPWQSGIAIPDIGALSRHLRDGGRVVIGYTGAELAWTERFFLDDLGIAQDDLDLETSLIPWKWWSEQKGERLRTAGRLELPEEPEVERLHWVPEAPGEGLGEVLLETQDGHAALTRRRQLGGEIWLVPTSLFANGYLSRVGNSATLLTLAPSWGEHLIFDELHHGLVGERGTEETTTSQGSFDATLLQLGLVYVVALVAFAWRFGPSWPPRLPSRDSHREFLIGIGGVHERLGHDVDAARTLVDRASHYWPRRFSDQQVAELRADVTRRSLLDLANELSLTSVSRRDDESK